MYEVRTVAALQKDSHAALHEVAFLYCVRGGWQVPSSSLVITMSHYYYEQSVRVLRSCIAVCCPVRWTFSSHNDSYRTVAKLLAFSLLVPLILMINNSIYFTEASYKPTNYMCSYPVAGSWLLLRPAFTSCSQGCMVQRHPSLVPQLQSSINLGIQLSKWWTSSLPPRGHRCWVG